MFETALFETGERHVFCLPARSFVCPAIASIDRISRRARMSSSRAGSPWSSAQLIRHEFIAFVAWMPRAFFGQALPGKRNGTTGFSEGMKQQGRIEAVADGDSIRPCCCCE
jgi:hypothetical protein